jgi:hypothetical protein
VAIESACCVRMTAAGWLVMENCLRAGIVSGVATFMVCSGSGFIGSGRISLTCFCCGLECFLSCCPLLSAPFCCDCCDSVGYFKGFAFVWTATAVEYPRAPPNLLAGTQTHYNLS